MMKANLFTTLLLAAGCFVASAQTERYVTLTSKPIPPAEVATNTYTITESDTAEIVSLQSSTYANLSITKDGIIFPYFTAADHNSGGRGSIIQGPATFTLFAGSSTAAYLTLKVMPGSFPPGQTLILPAGTVGIVHVQSSTNLVQWQDEWVQTFGNTNGNRFFRLSAERSLP
jgi:hypothetical protein